MTTRWVVVSLALLVSTASLAQDETDVYAITGATIYTLVGDPILEGTIVIRGGRISEVGADVTVPAGAEIVDASGLGVYPGAMDASSVLGLVEVGSTVATVDVEELGDFNPHLRAITAIHPASEHIPVARANGITHAVSAPGGDRYGIHGQASLVNLAGWTVEEMSVEPSVGMVLSWPSLETTNLDSSTFERSTRPFSEVKQEYDERVAELEEWMEAARRYRQAREADREGVALDLKLEALIPVVSGELPLLVRADDERAIRDAVAFAERVGARMVLLSGRDGWKVKALLADKGIPVILGPTLALPTWEDEPYDKPFATPAELAAAGVRVIFASFDASDSRLLPYEAGNAVAHGLPREEGLKGITLYPAEIFGVADRLGSIEEGKIANLIVTDGDPLEIRTQIKYLFISGKLTSLDNKHLRLYERYRARP